MRQDKHVKFKGQVVQRIFAPGSKSEHLAVCLVDAKERSLRLRRPGEDPWHDPTLIALVGKTIAGTGEMVHGNTLFIREWTEI